VKQLTQILLVLPLLIACKKDEHQLNTLGPVKGKILKTYCSGTAVQLIGVGNDKGQNWLGSSELSNESTKRDTLYNHVVLTNPIPKDKQVLGSVIEFTYTKVKFFNLPYPICDLGIVGLDTLYQINHIK
jgi:hypothetical protein